MGLLDPLALGGRSARNRIVFGPHETNLGRGRSISDRHVAYYARRAAGGCGVIVTEEASVHPSDWPYERAPLASECNDGWAAVADACHAEGALVLAAIGHSGGQGSSAYSQLPLLAPSPVPEVASREVPKEMEQHDIDAVVAGFAEATRLAVAAGCDGVEVNAGQLSLVRQFLSGLTNARSDAYGEDRLRFAREVLAAARASAGDAVVALRLSCDELAPWAGLVPDAGAQVAAELAGDADLLTVVRGSIYTVWATRPDMHVEPGFNVELCRTVRAAVAGRVPVVLQGSVVDPAQAAWAIDDGVCDAVEMTRAQIADADLAGKVAARVPERVRPCILCNQTCKVRDARNPIVSCVGDPRSGHELDDPLVDEGGAAGGTLTVFGGGPAGLECARVAAAGGMQVRLVERTERLGGMVRTAAAAPGRERLALLVDWLESECRRLGVVFELERSEAPSGGQISPARCTGGVDGDLPFEVDGEATVVHAAAYLAGAALPSGATAVWDPIGGPIGISVAERLRGDGRDVTLVTPDLVAGNELSRTGDMAPAQVRLHGAGIGLVKRAVVRRVTAGSVLYEDRFTGIMSSLDAVAVVACGHRLPGPDGPGPRDAIAGDAVAPRTIHEAVLEGRRAAQRALVDATAVPA